MKGHAIYLSVIMLLCTALAIGYRYHGATTDIAAHKESLLLAEVTAQVQEAQKWQLAAHYYEASILGLKETATACLQREAKAHEDREEREAIMNTAPPIPFNRVELKGVSHGTRRAAADYLNRPL